MDPGRIDLIFPPIDPDFFLVAPETSQQKPDVIKELGIPEDRQIFGFIGRLSWGEGPAGVFKPVSVISRIWVMIATS